MSLTTEQRNELDAYTRALPDSYRGYALAAALADLDAANESCAVLKARWDQLRVDRDDCCKRLVAALADLDACRAALGPVVREIRRVRPESDDLVLVVHRCQLSLTNREADAVLAAAGEESAAPLPTIDTTGLHAEGPDEVHTP